jgi:hypothetical protein
MEIFELVQILICRHMFTFFDGNVTLQEVRRSTFFVQENTWRYRCLVSTNHKARWSRDFNSLTNHREPVRTKPIWYRLHKTCSDSYIGYYDCETLLLIFFFCLRNICFYRKHASFECTTRQRWKSPKSLY